MRRWFVIALSCIMCAAATGQESIGEGDAPAPWNPQVDEYMVEAGDTLWDISERVLGDPFLWPKVWSFNPEITNPHWIYPGDIVRFYEPELDMPSQNQLVSSQMDMPEDDVDEITDYDDTVVEDAASVVEVVETTAAVRQRRRDAASRRFVGLFVTEDELQESGVLTNARHDKILLSRGDEIFFEPRGTNPAKGDRLMIYRTIRPVQHPVDGGRWGFLTQVTGSATVSSKEDDVVLARIDSTVVEVERGQLLTPMVQNPDMRLVRSPASKNIEGVVLAVRDWSAGIAGTEELVFVDKGKADGVERGNQFRVLVKGDPLTGTQAEIPYTSIGILHVVDAKENAATCLVIRAMREIEPGQKVRTVVQ